MLEELLDSPMDDSQRSLITETLTEALATF